MQYTITTQNGLVVSSPEYAVMEKFSITRTEAIRTINDINKHRREYYKYYTGNDWDSAKNYDLCINTEDYDFDSAAELIRRYASITDNK